MINLTPTKSELESKAEQIQSLPTGIQKLVSSYMGLFNELDSVLEPSSILRDLLDQYQEEQEEEIHPIYCIIGAHIDEANWSYGFGEYAPTADENRFDTPFEGFSSRLRRRDRISIYDCLKHGRILLKNVTKKQSYLKGYKKPLHITHPDCFVHPSKIRDVFNEVIKETAKSLPVVVSTHNVLLVNEFRPWQVFITYKNNETGELVGKSLVEVPRWERSVDLFLLGEFWLNFDDGTAHSPLLLGKDRN